MKNKVITFQNVMENLSPEIRDHIIELRKQSRGEVEHYKKLGIDILDTGVASIPLYILDEKKLKDLKEFKEILIGHHFKDNKLMGYKKQQTVPLSDIRIHPKPDLQAATLSCEIMDPKDIEEFGLHDVYHYQLYKILEGLKEVKNVGPILHNYSDLKDYREFLNSRIKGGDQQSLIGSAGFDIEFQGTTFRSILTQLTKFILKVDSLTRKAMFN